MLIHKESDCSCEKMGATFSSCGKYRYALSRVWGGDGGIVVFVGLNPSTADHEKDDPTIKRCRSFAKSWGFRGMLMLNLFALRETDPKVMKKHPKPIGEENDIILYSLSLENELTVACWGNDGKHLGRDKEVLKDLKNPHALKITKSGQPWHPLYLDGKLKPKLWEFKSE